MPGLYQSHKSKILIVSDGWRKENIGSSNYINNLSKELTNRGIQVKVFSGADCNNTVMGVPWPRSNTAGKWCRWAKNVHITTPNAPIGFRIMLYCIMHSIPFTTGINNRTPKNLSRLILLLSHTRSKKVLVPTLAMKLELEAAGFARVGISPQGVHSKDYNPSYQQSPYCGRPVLLCVSNIETNKNLEEFCELKVTERTTRVIIGEGAYKEALSAKYPDVIFTGHLSHTELATWYATADCLVYPTKTDSFSVSLMESISCGTPVAGHPVPSAIDIIEEGITGCLDENLQTAVEKTLKLDRELVSAHATDWTWEGCTDIFLGHLHFK